MGRDSPVDARAESAWMRSYPFWDAYFAIVLIACIVIIVIDDGSPAGIVPLLLIAASYVLWGRTAVRRPDGPIREGLWHAVAMLVLFVPASLLAPQSGIALAALVPMAFMSLRRAQAAAWLAAMLAGPAVQLMTGAGAHPAGVAVAVLLTLSVSTLLGVFIDRLARQNTERAQLIEELDRTREELAEVSEEAGMLAERERLAGDIHDTLAQGYASILMLLQAADGQDGQGVRAMQIARDNLAETRALIAALTPPVLEDATLEEALARLARGFELPAEVVADGPPLDVPPAVAETLVRAAQEGLANVRKHAHAGSVRLALEHVPGSAVRMSISDDGRGFDPGAVAGGYGLRAMRNRVARHGGTVSVTCAPGGGTTVAVEVPCSG